MKVCAFVNTKVRSISVSGSVNFVVNQVAATHNLFESGFSGGLIDQRVSTPVLHPSMFGFRSSILGFNHFDLAIVSETFMPPHYA